MLQSIRLACIVLAILGGPDPAEPARAEYEVRSPGITVQLSANGTIAGVVLGSGKLGRPVTGGTQLAGGRRQGDVLARRLDGGGVEFRRELVFQNPVRQCTQIDRFLPTKDSVRWEIEIRGPGEPWTTAFVTHLSYPAAPSRVFWTAWSDPEHRNDGWRDPLVFRPFTGAVWTYANTKPIPKDGDFMMMPLAVAAEPAADVAMSVVLSPEDTLLDLTLSTDESGAIVFTRTHHRLGGDRPIRFSLDLVGHPADWRGALGWLVARYPQYFNPVNPKADAMAGCGAYSGDENPVDVAKLKRMAFRVNWKLSDDFPYMGMFLPPLESADARWERSCAEPSPPGKPRWTSFRRLNDYARYMRNQGFYVLNYFNVTEFGRNMKDVPAPVAKAADRDLWKSPAAYLEAVAPNAPLRPLKETCYGAWVTDVGDPAYERLMLEQAKRHIEKLPDTAGICIDRLDWLACYNPRGDDGASWVDGRPARSLYLSWRGFMTRLDPLMHDAGKVIFVNNHRKRLEILRNIDGLYCEHCDWGPALNSTGLMCLRRPAIGWTGGLTASIKDLGPSPDSFFQRHMHLGVYPTAPYPTNNHCIGPAPEVDRHFLDYGPLLDVMRGKKWVLEPHCIETATPGVTVNLFQVPGGYVAPVTFGGKTASAVVRVRNIPGLDALLTRAIHPGVALAVPVKSSLKDGALELAVPLVRGCAMVRLVSRP
jgi:hypothetical protein